MTRGSVRRSILACASILALQSGVAFAQEGQNISDTSVEDAELSSPKQLNTVVVTARRTEEDLQSVPVTVTALSGDDLVAKGINDASDLQFSAPSVTVSTGLSRLEGSYSVRGLGAGVVTYFNDIPGGPVETAAPFFDMASVQILNGPQGTLFGRTAAAGAVLLTPRAPSLDDFEGRIDFTAGNYDQLESSGALNIPLIEGELGLRLAFQHQQRDGYTAQIGGGRALDGIENTGIRASLLWERGNFSNTLIGNYLNIEDTGQGWVLAAANPELGILNLQESAAPFVFGGVCQTAVSAGLESSVSECVSSRFEYLEQTRALMVSENARIRSGGDDVVRETIALDGIPDAQLYRHESIMNISEYDFGDIGLGSLSVKNLFSFQETSSVAGYALDGLGGRLLAIGGGTVARAPARVNQTGNDVQIERGTPGQLMTEELQFRGDLFDAVDWTVGAFYQKSETTRDLTGVRTMIRSFGGVFLPNRGFSPSFDFDAGSESEEMAGYANLSFDMTRFGVPGLTLAGGYRYTDAETISRSIPAIPNPTGTGPVVAPDTLGPISTTSSDSSGSNYSFSATQKVSDNLTVYGSLAKSFVPGGVNSVAGCELAPNCSPTFDPENVKNYEIGVKSQFFLGDVPITLNSAIYQMNYEDIQQGFQFTSGSASIAYTQNVAKAKMQGFETYLNMEWTEDLDLTLNYSYLDAGYEDWIALDPNQIVLPGDQCLQGSSPETGCLIDLSGNPLPRAPKQQFNATLRYNLPVPEAYGSPSLTLTGYLQSRQYLIPTAAYRAVEVAQAMGIVGVDRDTVSQEPYGLVNLRLQWDEVMGSPVSAGVFVNNLTDEVYSQGGGANLFTLGTAFKLYSEPRMWGLNVSYEF